jgi:hypothetical protein
MEYEILFRFAQELVCNWNLDFSVSSLGGLDFCFRWVYLLIYFSVSQPFLLPTAHPNLTMACEDTPQIFALRKGGKETICATQNADPTCKSLIYID